MENTEVFCMIRIAVVDDDEFMLSKIGSLIRKAALDEKIIIESYQNSIDFFQNIETLIFDVVFLDIDMPEISGFEIADILNSVKPDTTIIFVSNMEHLVFQSFEFNPFRFVRKSCLENDIFAAVKSYLKEITKMQDTLFFKTIESEIMIPTFEIVYFESMGHDIFILTTNNKYKLKREHDKEISMKSLSEQLKSKGFIRVHKSFPVNYKHIYVINRNEIILKNNMQISINPHKYNEIKDFYQQFLMMEA